MKHRYNAPACAAALAGLALTLTPLSAQVVFSESFEAPVVSGFATNTVPSGGKWIGASNGFGSGNRGLYNEAVVWPSTPVFSTPFGVQAYFINYTNSALTTAVGATGQTVVADVPFTVTFNTAVLDGVASGSYLVELVAFGPADDNVARRDGQSSRPGTVLASASGPVTGSDMSVVGSLTFTAAAGNAHLGKDLGIRIVKANNSVLYDNVRLILGHDFAPVPASGLTMPAGSTVLSWTNMPPNAPATDVHVDVFFGSDPGNLNLVMDGGLNTSTTNVNVPGAGTYYWRVDSYLDGDPNGTPVTGDVFFFTVTDSDGDGIPDAWEIQYFGSATGAEASADSDNDGLTNLQEFIRGTNPINPDTDNDGLFDGVETATGIWVSGTDTGTHPLIADTDGDGLLDGVETNTGTWVSASNTGTDPHNPDSDGDGLLDGWETNTGVFVSRFNTGTDPHDKDTDGDGAWDYYEVAAAFTDPNDPNDTPSVPYPLPAPVPSDTGVTDKPVKVYILSGQSNMLGFGKVSGTGDHTLDTITRRFNRFPNLIGPGGEYVARQDVKYRGVYSGIANMPLAPGGGKDGDSIGPELGFGHIMGWYHDEPVLLLKSSIGNRSLGWDVLPPGSPSYVYENTNYPGYGGFGKWPVGEEPPTSGGWYAGKEFDGYFKDESEWAQPGTPVTNVVDVLDNFATQYPEWAAQGFEIAGFAWWQGDKDRYDMGHATRYERNLVNLINTLRSYYGDRYPGKVVPNAPFVLATLGQTTMDSPNAAEKAILDAKFAVDGESGKYPEFAGNVKTVYANPLSQGGSSNAHYNLNAETYMLVGDALGLAMLEMQDDTNPPSPNPLTFAIEPAAVDATTVGMVATTAFDVSGPVVYFFENTTNADSSGWITTTRWDNTGLAGGSYDYRVKARDALGNEGDWSATLSASPGADVTAPSPDPMSFASLPVALGEVSITMSATTASDINGVEYYFESASGPDSGWQASPEYTAVGLNPGTEYTYVVRARDSVGNITGDSAPASATTTAPDTTPPSPDPMSFASAPAAIGTSAITMTATAASDPSGVEYFFEAVSGGTSSGWQDSATYTDSSLSPGTEYGYRVQARDKSPARNTTGWSDVLTATTETPDTTPPVISSLNPALGATHVAVAANLSVTFDEEITIGTGLITIKNLTDSTQFTIDITDGSQVSASGAVLTINPTANLANSKNHAIQIAATAIKDLEDNFFPGILDDATWNFTTVDPPPGGIVFADDFEPGANTYGGTTPDVTTYTLSQTSRQANTALWVRATSGYGSGENGLVDESENGGANFTDPSGTQAYAFRYTNSGVTTAAGKIGTLTAGTTITVSFDAVKDGFNGGLPYNAYLVLFDSGAARNATETHNKNTAAVLAQRTGSVPDDADYHSYQFSYVVGNNVVDNNGAAAGTSTAWLPSLLGKDIALRFGGATSTANIDNVVVTIIGPDGPGPVASFEISPISSPQTVGTPITGITITAKDAANQTATGFTGTVTFGGTGGFTGTSATFTGGVLNGVSATPTASGSNLTFTVADGAGSTGAATIATIHPAPSPYDAWADGALFASDANGDGIANGMAWLLGAANPAADAVALLPTGDEESGSLVIRFRMRNAASRGDAVLQLQHSGDLGAADAWTSIIVPETSTTVSNVGFVITPDGDVNDVVATIPLGEGAAGRLFARLLGEP